MATPMTDFWTVQHVHEIKRQTRGMMEYPAMQVQRLARQIRMKFLVKSVCPGTGFGFPLFCFMVRTPEK